MSEPSQQGTGRIESPSGATNHEIERHIPLVDAAKKLGVNPRTLRGWATDGVNGCPAVIRLGSRNLHFVASELAEWVQSRRQAEGSDAQSA